MKGQAGGGMSIFNVLLFYTVFLFFVGFLSIYAGVTILTVGGNPYNVPIPTFDILNPLATIGSTFNFFVAFLSTNTAYVLLAAVLITPFVILLLYGILQLMRGTG